MLITELPSSTRKKALAQELRKLIEPDKAQSKQVLKETEIRKFLSKQGYTYYGLSDIIAILKANYSSKTVSRLISKIQKPVVWDTCICNLSSQELTDMLYDEKVDNIITTAVFDELLKLAISTNPHKSGIENARKLVEDILEDSDSKFCTIVDLPKDTCFDNYVDNQLIWYCSKNNYELYTHDYVLGLRCKLNKVQVKIFTSFTETIPYLPNPNGKNIILHCDLIDAVIDNLPVHDITNAAIDLSANKFILTRKFIETLERKCTKKNNMDLVKFLVNDTDNVYTMFVNEDEGSDLVKIAKDNNAIIFSSDISRCIEYKKNFAPYKLVKPSKDSSFKNRLHRALICTNFYRSDTDYEDNLDENGIANADTADNKSGENITEFDEKATNIAKDSESVKTTTAVSENKVFSLIPHYKPKTHQILIRNIPNNEEIWVLNENGKELKADYKTGFPAYKDYTVIHILNNLRGSYKLNVYKILNLESKNYGIKSFTVSFTKENFNSVVDKDYVSYAKRALMLT